MGYLAAGSDGIGLAYNFALTKFFDYQKELEQLDESTVLAVEQVRDRLADITFGSWYMAVNSADAEAIWRVIHLRTQDDTSLEKLVQQVREEVDGSDIPVAEEHWSSQRIRTTKELWNRLNQQIPNFSTL